VLLVQVKRGGGARRAHKDIRAGRRQVGRHLLRRPPELSDNLPEQGCVFRVCADIAQLHPSPAAFDLRQCFHSRQLGPLQLAIQKVRGAWLSIINWFIRVIAAKIQDGMPQGSRQPDEAGQLQQRMPNEMVRDLETDSGRNGR